MNRAIGASDAGPLDQVFYLASQMAEPYHGAPVGPGQSTEPDWRRRALEAGGLREAYVLAVAERTALVRQAGLTLAQDLHLLDAVVRPTAEVLAGPTGDEATSPHRRW